MKIFLCADWCCRLMDSKWNFLLKSRMIGQYCGKIFIINLTWIFNEERNYLINRVVATLLDRLQKRLDVNSQIRSTFFLKISPWNFSSSFTTCKVSSKCTKINSSLVSGYIIINNVEQQTLLFRSSLLIT